MDFEAGPHMVLSTADALGRLVGDRWVWLPEPDTPVEGLRKDPAGAEGLRTEGGVAGGGWL